MKYYSIQPTREVCIAGAFPQAVATERNLFGSPFSPINIQYPIIRDTIPFAELELVEGAQLTDVLSSYSIPFGLLVSKRLMSIFSRFRLPPHKFYEIRLANTGEQNCAYYWMHCYDDLWQYIEPTKTIFEIFHRTKRIPIKEVFIDSRDRLNELEVSLGFLHGVRLKTLVFTEQYPNYDVVLDHIVSLRTLVSDKMIEELVRANITGYDICEIFEPSESKGN